jgi:hypothetical protein
MGFLFYHSAYLDFFNKNIFSIKLNQLMLFTSLHDNYAISFTYAPYGDIEGEAKESEVIVFIEKMISAFELLNIQSIKIKCKPSFIATPTQLLFHELLEKKYGFEVELENVQHTLIVDEEALIDKIKYQEKRKLKTLKKEVIVKRLSAPDDDSWFDLLKLARQHKGYPLTTTKYNYEELPKVLSDCYYFIGAYKNEELIATCIGVKVTSDILYYYLPATHPLYVQYSPSVLLLDNLYQLATELNIKYIDLGISNNQDGTLNHGLVKFKENMGGIAGIQKILQYNF